MNNGKKITNTIVAVVLFSTVMWQSPSNAMVWPSTDIVQISSILNNISNGFTKVASVGMQLKNYNATIHAIGDQMNVVAKYAKDINKTMDSIKSNVDKITTSTTKAINDTSKVVKNLKDKTDDASVENKQLADNTVAEVEASISTPEANNNMKAALETGQKDTERNNQETKQAIQQTKTTVKNLTDNTRFALNGLTDIIVNKGELENDVKADLQKEAKKIDNQIIDYNIHADKIISEIEDENNSNNEKVSDAYDKYGQKVDAFSNKSITQKELIEAGQEFKKDMASIPTVSSQEKVKTLTKEGEEITNSMQNLKEKILDNIANNKDYSDEDTDKTSAVFLEKKVNFAYNNHSEHKHIFMKGIYAKDISLDCGNAHNSFMLSYELKTDNGACSKQNFEDIKDPQKINQFMDALRDCVVRAKAEVEYICPEKNDFSQCDIYEIEPKFKEYQEKGVYQHILEDYNVASITNNMQCRQYVSSWLDIEENKSTLKVLMTQMQNVKNIRDAYALQSLIDLEAPQLWSYLRRVDSIQRAKDVINEYRVQPTLHIDERDDDFTKAQKQNLGKNILSNVILYKCDMNGNDVSVAPDDNDKEEKARQAEENIKKCFMIYAEAAEKGTIGGKPNGSSNPSAERERWRVNKRKALMDSLFYTFALSTINNYKSALDFNKKAKEDEQTIMKLQKNVKEAKVAREDYAAGAEINRYATKQLLTIVDADAQSLQSEIIRDLQTISYDYFGELAGSGEN